MVDLNEVQNAIVEKRIEQEYEEMKPGEPKKWLLLDRLQGKLDYSSSHLAFVKTHETLGLPTKAKVTENAAIACRIEQLIGEGWTINGIKKQKKELGLSMVFTASACDKWRTSQREERWLENIDVVRKELVRETLGQIHNLRMQIEHAKQLPDDDPVMLKEYGEWEDRKHKAMSLAIKLGEWTKEDDDALGHLVGW